MRWCPPNLATPCLLWLPHTSSDLTRVGLWLRHHLPAWQGPSIMPALGVGLLLSWSTFQDRESIHAAAGGLFFFFEDKRGLTAARRKSCRASLQQQLVQLPTSIPCLLSDQSPSPQDWGSASSCEGAPASTGSWFQRQRYKESRIQWIPVNPIFTLSKAMAGGLKVVQ